MYSLTKPGIVIASASGMPASRHSLRMLVPYSNVGTPAAKNLFITRSWAIIVSRARRRYSSRCSTRSTSASCGVRPAGMYEMGS
jgi:hypothetical protein